MAHAVQIYFKRALLLWLVLVPGGELYAGPDQTALLSDLDIPLMQGFQEDADRRVMFDTPAGRIIEVQAIGSPGAARVFDYYRLVLPTLAWRIRADKIKKCDRQVLFCIKAHRDGEILILEIRQIKQPRQKTVIYFSVNPE